MRKRRRGYNRKNGQKETQNPDHLKDNDEDDSKEPTNITNMIIVIIQLRFICGQLHQLNPNQPIFLLSSHQWTFFFFFLTLTFHVILWPVFQVGGFRDIRAPSVIVGPPPAGVPVTGLWGYETSMLSRNATTWRSISLMCCINMTNRQ